MSRVDAKIRNKTTAYGFFTKDYFDEHKKKYPDNRDFLEVTKKCGETWKTMSEEDRRPFKEMAAKDAIRYQEEVEARGVAAVVREAKKRKIEVKELKKAERKIKDPDAPKRPMTSYLMFANSVRAKVREEHPEWKMVDIAKEMGRLWKELDPEEKKVFEARASEKKALWEQAKKEYETGKYLKGVLPNTQTETTGTNTEPSSSSPPAEEEKSEVEGEEVKE